LNVKLAVPVVAPEAVIDPTEHVAAGLAEGATAQLRLTADRFNPPSVVIVTIDDADDPGTTEPGVRAVDVIVNPGPFTASPSTADTLERKLVSPEYDAVMLSVPAGSEVVENVATALPPKLELPSCVVPLKNVTVPVGTPPAPETVAVKATF
jgi:hypothetical protein